MRCVRCGRKKQLEEHHIIPRSEGGSDDPENKEWRCVADHKYIHAKWNILKALEKQKERGEVRRVAVLEHRLEVLEKLNTPKLIRKRGTYQSYWEDETTHFYPPCISKRKRRQQEAQGVLDLRQEVPG